MTLPLPVVDGFQLRAPLRSLLLPGALVRDSRGRTRRLPRFFYAIESWQTARDLKLSPNFALWEFIDVDLYEATPVRLFPRYVPCAITLLAAHLEVLRGAVGVPVRIAANGAYRSPSHGRSTPGSPHSWGSAANIYRIGEEYLDEREKIEKYAAVVASLMPAVRTRPYGSDPGCVDDHLHLDLGHVVAVPMDAAAEES